MALYLLSQSPTYFDNKTFDGILKTMSANFRPIKFTPEALLNEDTDSTIEARKSENYLIMESRKTATQNVVLRCYYFIPGFNK